MVGVQATKIPIATPNAMRRVTHVHDTVDEETHKPFPDKPMWHWPYFRENHPSVAVTRSDGLCLYYWVAPAFAAILTQDKGPAHGWNVDFDWAGKDHGGHISTPAIVGNRVIVRPRVIELETGRLLDGLLPHQKCGSIHGLATVATGESSPAACLTAAPAPRPDRRPALRFPRP